MLSVCVCKCLKTTYLRTFNQFYLNKNTTIKINRFDITTRKTKKKLFSSSLYMFFAVNFLHGVIFYLHSYTLYYIINVLNMMGV